MRCNCLVTYFAVVHVRHSCLQVHFDVKSSGVRDAGVLPESRAARVVCALGTQLSCIAFIQLY